MTVKSSISLTDEQFAYARQLIEEGRFPSVSAVMQQGLDLSLWRVEGEATETAALRELLARRRAGPFVTAEEMDRRLARIIAG